MLEFFHCITSYFQAPPASPSKKSRGTLHCLCPRGAMNRSYATGWDVSTGIIGGRAGGRCGQSPFNNRTKEHASTRHSTKRRRAPVVQHAAADGVILIRGGGVRTWWHRCPFSRPLSMHGRRLFNISLFPWVESLPSRARRRSSLSFPPSPHLSIHYITLFTI